MSGGLPPADHRADLRFEVAQAGVDDLAFRSRRRTRRAAICTAGLRSEVSTPIIVTVVPARSAPSMPLSAPLPAPALPAALGRAAGGSVPAGSVPAGSVPAGSVPAGSVPAAAVSSGAVVSVPALATLAAPSTPTIASGTNIDLTRERERMCSPFCPATAVAGSLTVVVSRRIRPRHNARRGRFGQAVSGGTVRTCQVPRHLDLVPSTRRQGERVEVVHAHRPRQLVGGERRQHRRRHPLGRLEVACGALTTPQAKPVDTTSWTCITWAHDSAKSSHGWAAA